jgi:hypothetical protein
MIFKQFWGQIVLSIAVIVSTFRSELLDDCSWANDSGRNDHFDHLAHSPHTPSGKYRSARTTCHHLYLSFDLAIRPRSLLYYLYRKSSHGEVLGQANDIQF